MFERSRRLTRRRLGRLAACAVVAAGFCGCAGFWDDVTSRDFAVKQLFVKTDPMVVLRESNDGDRRAQAMRALPEPKQHGGTDQEQKEAIDLLTKAATTDRHPLCRLAAVQALSRFKDPAAVDALKAVAHTTGNEPLPPEGLVTASFNPGSVSPELNTNLRCRALAALGETKNPAALETLVQALGESPRPGAEQERQQVMDVRLAAARALGNFRHPAATEALLRVLETEKDVALRDSACESLKACTGKDLPPDFKAWNAYLHRRGYAPPTLSDKVRR